MARYCISTRIRSKPMSPCLSSRSSFLVSRHDDPTRFPSLRLVVFSAKDVYFFYATHLIWVRNEVPPDLIFPHAYNKPSGGIELVCVLTSAQHVRSVLLGI